MRLKLDARTPEAPQRMNLTTNRAPTPGIGPHRSPAARAGRRAAGLAILLAVLAPAEPSRAQVDCTGFLEHDIMSGGTNGVVAVHAADLDGDMLVDIIAASSNDDTITWYRNNGAVPPVFERRVIAQDADGVSSIHAADVDGDGDVDILAASANDNTIALYENVGSGQAQTFVRLIISRSARRPLSVFAADVDSDGDLDILSASFTDNTIAWYENPRINNEELNPDGAGFGFTRRIVSTGAINAAAVFAAKVNDPAATGKMDVLSASIGDDKIAWYQNEGVDTTGDRPEIKFTEHVITTDRDGARAIFAADLDGDGDIDVLAASISDDTLAWYENDPTASSRFVEHVISTTVDGVKSVFAADLDGDLDLDIVVAAEQAGAVYWFENVAGQFTQRVVSADIASADAVFAIDLDRDGEVDVLSASSVPGSTSDNDKLAWHKNDGGIPPGWTENVVASTAEGLNALFLADLDGDMEDDLVAATTSDQIVWYSISGGNQPTFNRSLVADGVLDARAVFAYDLDNDGDQDVISASARHGIIYWHENPLNPAPGKIAGVQPAFTTRVVAFGLVSPESVFVADLDDDGDGDVISASSGDDTIAWYENCLSGACSVSGPTPEFVEHVLASNNALESQYRTVSARSVFAVDVDKDGDIDVLSASSGDGKVSIFENDGQKPPTFVEKIIASGNLSDAVFSEPGAFSVSATDVDNDGDIDLLVAASSAGRITWYEQDVDPENSSKVTFTQRFINQFAPLAVFVGFADVDGDGDADVLATSLGDDRVLWHENMLEERAEADDPLEFTRHFVNFDGADPRSVVTLDVNDDLDLDMLVGFRFRSAWFEQIGELCVNFDVNEDGVMDGVELAWVGRAFGLSSSTPETEWWYAADFNQDGVVDGLDLAILSSPGVWGESTAVVDGLAECSYTCQ